MRALIRPDSDILPDRRFSHQEASSHSILECARMIFNTKAIVAKWGRDTPHVVRLVRNLGHVSLVRARLTDFLICSIGEPETRRRLAEPAPRGFIIRTQLTPRSEPSSAPIHYAGGGVLPWRPHYVKGCMGRGHQTIVQT